MSNEQAVATTGTLPLGDKVFIVRRPTPSDLVLVKQHLKKVTKAFNPIEAIKDDLKFLTPEQQAIAIREAVAQKREVKLTQQDAEDYIFSAAGCRFMLWVAARRDQPGLSVKDLEPLITEDNAVEVAAQLSEATGMDKATVGN